MTVASPASLPTEAAKPPLARRLLVADLSVPFYLACVKVLIHLPFITRYGYFRDELYYLACARRLDWGYVDQPPLSIALLALVRATLGDALWAIRLVPVLAGGLTVFMVGLLARELGGGRFAQGMAALAAVIAPVYLGTNHFFSMNSFDLLIWTLAAYTLVRLVKTEDQAGWLVLGLLLGLGLLDKISALWLGGGIAIGILLTGHRAWLRTPGPWVAALIAVVLFVPHLLWQQAHGWPTLEFMRNATAEKMRGVSPFTFVIRQVLEMNPINAPIWLAGLVHGFTPAGRRWRILGLIYLAVAALLVIGGRSRASYLVPAYPLLLAPGAVVFEAWLSGARRRHWRAAAIASMAVAGLVLAPLALPILPPEHYARYARALGFTPSSEENLRMGALPQQFADMFGWEALAAKVAAIVRELTPEERSRAVIYARNYGEAGALELFAARYGLPRVVCPHNNYWLWGPGPLEPRPLAFIILGGDEDDNRRAMEWLEPRGTIGCTWCMPYERDRRIYLGRRPRVKLEEIWPRERVFI